MEPQGERQSRGAPPPQQLVQQAVWAIVKHYQPESMPSITLAEDALARAREHSSDSRKVHPEFSHSDRAGMGPNGDSRTFTAEVAREVAMALYAGEAHMIAHLWR